MKNINNQDLLNLPSRELIKLIYHEIDQNFSVTLSLLESLSNDLENLENKNLEETITLLKKEATMGKNLAHTLHQWLIKNTPSAPARSS